MAVAGRGGGVIFFFPPLSLFVSRPCREEAVCAALVIRAGLSWAVLKISGGLWGGTGSERGEQMRDNDPGCFTLKRQSYKFIYLLSADPPGAAPPRRGELELALNASACHNIEENVKEEE